MKQGFFYGIMQHLYFFECRMLKYIHLQSFWGLFGESNLPHFLVTKWKCCHCLHDVNYCGYPSHLFIKNSSQTFTFLINESGYLPAWSLNHILWVIQANIELFPKASQSSNTSKSMNNRVLPCKQPNDIILKWQIQKCKTRWQLFIS